MPKLFGRDMPPVVIGLMGLVAVYLVYSAVVPGDAPVSTAKKSKPPVKKTSSDTDYLDTDYTFQINPLPDSVNVRDAFKPLVSKTGIGGNNGIPSIDNYTYSGMAQLNGVANGLLENGQTGEGDFVQPGQRWHEQWLVVKINPEEIEMKNDSGDITTLLAGAAATKSTGATPNVAASGGTGNPVMVGPIGASDITIQADAAVSQAQPQNTGRRRGRGRGRGGVAAPTGDGG